jgi:anti-sigma factor RsiW
VSVEPLCSNLVAFGDGELEAGPAELFRLHLRTCDDCRRGLIEHEVLAAHLSRLGESHVPPSAWQDRVLAEIDRVKLRRAVVREILYAAWFVACGVVGYALVRALLNL